MAKYTGGDKKKRSHILTYNFLQRNDTNVISKSVISPSPSRSDEPIDSVAHRVIKPFNQPSTFITLKYRISD
jgi:hypothetical protein